MFSRSVFAVLCLTSLVQHSAFAASDSSDASSSSTYPQLPPYLSDGYKQGRTPWGNRTVSNTNVYKDTPDTGVTRYYDFTLSRKQVSPDGYARSLILVNGQFPGPMIEANWGDWIQVTVKNDISSPKEGTAIHWHGLLQQQTPWFDGIPSVQQCPIAPGASFTYRFRADQYGSSWYHSHYSAQYTQGVYGPMIIHGPNHVNYDIDLGPIMLSDYYHKDYQQIVSELDGTNRTGFLQYSDANLINGKGRYNCSTNGQQPQCISQAPLNQFKFQKGKSYKLRLINSGSAGQQVFSIDEHQMTVIANDFVPIKPYVTKTVFLGIGQRTDVIINATGDSRGAYWMRSNISKICNLPRQPQGLAKVYYEKSDVSKDPTTQSWPYTDNGKCNNDDLSLTTPVYSITPDVNPASTLTVVVDDILDATGHHKWRIASQSFQGDDNNPLLFLAQQGNQSFSPERNVQSTGSSKTVRVVVNNGGPISHPMHLHGHDMFILHEGDGPWDGTSMTNPQNPQRRDVQMLRPGGHIVMQYDATNPGVWLFHCHIAWHLSAGLAMNFLEQPSDVLNLKIPQSARDNCKVWNQYSPNSTSSAKVKLRDAKLIPRRRSVSRLQG